VGKINNYFQKIGVAEIKMETQSLQTGDQILIIGPSTGVYEDTLGEIRVELIPVEKTIKGENCSIAVKETVRRGDKVYKLVEAIAATNED
jgi:putative protease